MCLHKVVETSGRAPSQQRSKMHNLFGRYPHPSTEEGYAATSNSGHSQLVGVSWFSGELQEVSSSANPGNNFSWFHSGLNQETAQSPSREDEADKGGGQQASKARGSISTGTDMFHRELTAAILAIYPAPLHYRGLQQLKHNTLRRAGYDGTMPISQRAREDLE